jgi:hypothetical protein
LPYEDTIRWIALGLLALGVLWVIAAAIGLRPRAMRLRRTIRRCGSASLLCGSCGHPATSLGEIHTCPECGSRYNIVGLDGMATASRWSPPVFVFGAFLLGLWTLGSISLAPMAARWANERTIGAPMVSSQRTLSGFTLAGPGVGPHAWPPVAVEFDARIFRPLDPIISLVPPPLPSSTITVRAAGGPGVSGARADWQTAMTTSPWSSQKSPYWIPVHVFNAAGGSTASPPPSTPPALASPWEAMFATSTPHALTIDPESERWTLRDPSGAMLSKGTGLAPAVSALLEAIGIGTSPSPDPNADEAARRALVGAITSNTTPKRRDIMLGLPPIGDPWSAPQPTPAATAAGLVSLGELKGDSTTHLLHRASPWGLAAGFTTSAALLLIAILLLTVSWRSRRPPTGVRT